MRASVKLWPRKKTWRKYHLHSQHSVFGALAEFGQVLAEADHLFVDQVLHAGLAESKVPQSGDGETPLLLPLPAVAIDDALVAVARPPNQHQPLQHVPERQPEVGLFPPEHVVYDVVPACNLPPLLLLRVCEHKVVKQDFTPEMKLQYSVCCYLCFY